MNTEQEKNSELLVTPPPAVETTQPVKETETEPTRHWSPIHTIAFFCIAVAVIGAISYGITKGANAFVLWSVISILILASMIIAGHGIVGVKLGFLIDDRNRVALSRLQLILWTTLILSAFFASVTINLNHAYKPSINATLVMNAATIAVPQEIWILMGIATTSLVGSPLILSLSKGKAETKTGDDIAKIAKRADVGKAHDALEKEGRASSDVTKFAKDQVDGQLIVNREPCFAGWSDMFKGDYTNNAGQLDLGKVQMLYFTIIVLVVYTAALVSLFVSTEEIHQFPPLGEGMVALLGISNGGYLAAKTVSPNKPN